MFTQVDHLTPVYVRQFCSSEWDEVCVQHSDGEESVLSPVDSCASALQEQEEQSHLSEIISHTEWVLSISFLIPLQTLVKSLG